VSLSINNPISNILTDGVEEQQIIEAVRISGYPLQTVIYEMLSEKFRIQEEWNFIDSDSSEERAIDLLAELYLYDLKKPQSRVRPILNLIMECKQSDMPYVFFLTKDKQQTPKFPVIAGLANKNITFTSDDEASTYNFSILQALELSNHKFLTTSPIFANTFSKGARKGKKIELSGSQPYQGLVNPLLKAIAYFEECEKPPETAHYYDCHITIPIAVIDGPMVGVKCTDSNEIEMVPWVRVPRHQTTNKDDNYHLENIGAIDVVHKDYLEEYISEHVMPFATDFADLILKHDNVIADSKGFISGMGNKGWSDIEKRIEPRKNKHIGKRARTIFNNLFNVFKSN
jgi:hypothetical protein